MEISFITQVKSVNSYSITEHMYGRLLSTAQKISGAVVRITPVV